MQQKEGDKSSGRKLPIECGGEKVEEKRWMRAPGRVQQFTKETPQGPVVQKEDSTVGSGGIVSCHYCGGVGGGRGGGGGG